MLRTQRVRDPLCSIHPEAAGPARHCRLSPSPCTCAVCSQAQPRLPGSPVVIPELFALALKPAGWGQAPPRGAGRSTALGSIKSSRRVVGHDSAQGPRGTAPKQPAPPWVSNSPGRQSPRQQAASRGWPGTGQGAGLLAREVPGTPATAPSARYSALLKAPSARAWKPHPPHPRRKLHQHEAAPSPPSPRRLRRHSPRCFCLALVALRSLPRRGAGRGV